MAFFPVDANTLHCWSFDEASGNTAADSVPGGTPMNPLDGLIPPITQSTFGRGRRVVGFDSATMCAPLTQAEVDYFRNSANPYTFEFIGITNDPGFASSLFGIDNRRVGGAGNHLYLQWLAQNNGNLNYLVQGWIAAGGGFGSGNNAFPHTAPTPIVGIHALVRESNGAGQHRSRIHVNGVLVHTTAWFADYVAADDGEPSFPYRYFAGRGTGGQWGWGGIIDEICISNIARTEEELAARAVGGGGGGSTIIGARFNRGFN